MYKTDKVAHSLLWLFYIIYIFCLIGYFIHWNELNEIKRIALISTSFFNILFISFSFYDSDIYIKIRLWLNK